MKIHKWYEHGFRMTDFVLENHIVRFVDDLSPACKWYSISFENKYGVKAIQVGKYTLEWWSDYNHVYVSPEEQAVLDAYEEDAWVRYWQKQVNTLPDNDIEV